jgi:hypothetical protein
MARSLISDKGFGISGEKLQSQDQSTATQTGGVMKKSVAAVLLALMMVPFIGTAAQASNLKEKVACLTYQTFRERDPEDYAECFA